MFSSRRGVVRECLGREIVLGSVSAPVVVSPHCRPRDISESSVSQVTVCLCDSDLCNAGDTQSPPGPPPPGPGARDKKAKVIQEIPRSRDRQRSDGLEVKEADNSPGLQCFSCGSLLNPGKEDCQTFDRTNISHSQTCLQGEACLLYSWRKSTTETATLRECFPTRVLLGSIQDPLTPQVSLSVKFTPL